MNAQTTQHQSDNAHVAPSNAKNFVVPIATFVALLSASCCVLPIGLTILGLGGSWLLILGPFVAYREIIIIAVAIALIWAWYRVLKPANCTKLKKSAVIWVLIGTFAFLIAASSPLWEDQAARIMWNLFRNTR